MVGVAVAYFLGGKIGLSLAFVHASATAVWPPTGIAIAALLFLGPRVWPGVFVGALLVNLTTAGSALTSLGIATGNTLEAVVAAYLVNRFARGTGAFERLGDVFRFAVFAALLSPVVSATFGVTSLCATGYAQWSEFGPIWTTWWLGDVGGALIVAPLLILWAKNPLSLGIDPKRRIELVMLVSALALTVWLVFGGLPSLFVRPLPFLTFPVLVWAAFRFGPRIAATALLFLAAAATVVTVQGHGPFAGPASNQSLLELQAFMAVAAVMTLALAAAERELRHAEAREVAERDAFIAIAAHELKTPITSLRLATELFNRNVARGMAPSDPALRDSLVTVEQQSHRLSRLVNELLDSARVRSGHLVLDRAATDVVEAVRRVVTVARGTTTRHEIVLTAPARLEVVLDQLRLEQVVGNLLDNAIKFSPHGGPIEVDLTGDAQGGLRLTVSDHGVGVLREHRHQIFDRFYKVNATDRRAGLGLGLYVSREIVELHGGRIVAEFPESGGTRMIVSIPNVLVAGSRGSPP
jgi:signal transduction histidine kinase